jgi:cytochrome c-type biogenesis protein CcmE
MLFDVIITLILFQGLGVLFRLTARRRSDVLYYVSSTDSSRRSSIGQRASPRGIVRSGGRARKPFSVARIP